MEDIDIENLNFDVYNREVYQGQGESSKSSELTSKYIDAQKKYKNEIDKFVENYYKSRANSKLKERRKFRKNQKEKILSYFSINLLRIQLLFCTILIKFN